MLKQISIYLILTLVLIFFSGIVTHLNAQPSGISITGNKTAQTLREAVEIAQPGDTLFLSEGVYKAENLKITKSLTIRGTTGAVIDLESKGFGLVVNAEDVILRDFEIRDSGYGFMEDFAAILIEDSKNVTVDNVRLIDNFFSIYVAKSSELMITNNYIESKAERQTTSGNGVHIWYSKDVEVHNNEIKGQRDGIYLEFVERSQISGNNVEGNIRYGLHFMYSDDCSYIGNQFRDNVSGVAVMYSKNVIMHHNHFIENWGANRYGLLLKEITDSDIKFNLFKKNSVGIYAEASNRINIERNEFYENGTGLRIMANGVDNRISLNNFIGNTFEVKTNSMQNPNVYTENYWSQYEGYDLDRDGIGDVPYRPVRLFSILTERQPSSLILLHSIMVQLLDTAERVMPALTPKDLKDEKPRMQAIQ